MEKSLFLNKFKLTMELNGMPEFASEDLASAFWELTQRMLSVNAHTNLTAIVDEEEIITKHYADSLSAAKYIPIGAKVIDVGCGGGFPSLPLALARNDISIVAIDSTAKKISYISETAKLLGISNICPLVSRAEDLAFDDTYRENFDVAIGRAVARLNVLCELCLPFVNLGGSFIAMKGAKASEELSEALIGIEKLGGSVVSCSPFDLHTLDASAENEERYLIISEKIGKTPKNYPRNYSQIKKKPL